MQTHATRQKRILSSDQLVLWVKRSLERCDKNSDCGGSARAKGIVSRAATYGMDDDRRPKSSVRNCSYVIRPDEESR
jgi:ribosomal protein S12